MFLYHVYSKDGNYYLYDVNSGKIAEITEEAYSYLSEMEKSEDKNEFIARNSGIKRVIKDARKLGLLLEDYTEYSIPYSDDYIMDLYKAKVKKLTLGLSEDCNLRCKYCVYSGSFVNRRQHRNKFMDYNTAKKSVDFYFKHSYLVENKEISFYGGEPLLNIKVLIKSIDYIRKIDKNAYIAVDTNGVLLKNGKLIDYFVKNNIHLQISLDGPKEMNDRYRVFPGGEGSYDIVYSNLNYLYEKYNKWYLNNISFNVTLVMPFDFLKLFSFIENDKLLKDNNVILTPVYLYGSKQSEIIFDNNDEVELNLLKDIFKEILIEGKRGRIFENINNLFSDSLLRIHREIRQNKAKDYLFPHAICFPGVENLFVSTNGDFYICEKVDDAICIGNVKEGYNFETIFYLLNNYVKIANSRCRNCWVRRLCGNCWANVIEKNDFDESKMDYTCKNNRKYYDNMLKFYTEVRMKNIHAFDYIDEI